MARANPSARKLLAAVVAPVVKAHGGPGKVAEIVDQHRTTVHRWTRAEIGWDGLALLASSLRVDIVVTFPAHGQPTAIAKEPPPEWARAMERRLLFELRLSRSLKESEVAGDEIEGMHDELHGEKPDEPPPDGDGQTEGRRPPGRSTGKRQ